MASGPLRLRPRRGRAGCRDQGGIDDGALAHRHAPCAEVGFDRLIDEVFCAAVDLLAQIVLLKQVAEGQDRRLIRDPVADQLDAGKAAHGGHLDQGLFHSRIAQRIPLLQQVDPKHGAQRIGRPAAFRLRPLQWWKFLEASAPA